MKGDFYGDGNRFEGLGDETMTIDTTQDPYLDVVIKEVPLISSLHQAEEPFNMTFHSLETDKQLGVLYEKNGKLHFEGDMEESAKSFMDFFCKQWNRVKMNEL